jgi:hypothetical protein
MVVEISNMSLLVKDVAKTMDAVISKVESYGGYMVNRSITSPEEGDTGTVIVRVPSDRLDEALEFFRGTAVRVVSENLIGKDVTDQYTDINARLEILYEAKAKFEQILDQAVQVQDILTVQRELTNLQAQIDSLKGQAEYLEKTSALAKVTLYISTDELSLPFAPAKPWRPGAVFKLAVRQLVLTIRTVGSAAIWVVVYSVIWLPIVLAVIFVPRIIKKKRVS